MTGFVMDIREEHQQDRHGTYNEAPRPVRVTTVTVEKQ